MSHVVLAVVVFGLFLVQEVLGSLPHVEVSALHDLYNATGGNISWAWRNETEYGTPWDFAQALDGSYLNDPCLGWQGIQCINKARDSCNTTVQQDVECNIVNINLFEYNLTGSVPSSLGFALSRLQELTLWRNTLSSSIPSSLGLLTDLVLLDFDQTGYVHSLYYEKESPTLSNSCLFSVWLCGICASLLVHLCVCVCW